MSTFTTSSKASGPVSPDEIAERRSAMRTPGVSPAVVVGGQDAYPQAAKLHEVTRLDLPELHTAGGD
jgi:hypothetical protein